MWLLMNKFEAVHRAVKDDRRVTLRKLAETFSISFGSVQKKFSKYLHMKKVSPRWVPRMLTEDQKTTRVNMSKELLPLYQQDTEGFLARIITQDETWVHHFDPETKTAKYAMEASWISTSKKIQEGSISRKDDGICILEYRGHNNDRLFRKKDAP